ncbi:MAG: hypothetical protein E7L45_06000 [Peptoniphilus lacydonensis]|uniref:hypothetical protein n=3 Tax=Peptoniphilaceae TaxID=1570339 RepID=UPI0002881283|nr:MULTISPECIES: hypothetical protein [Peptoniphilus]MDU7302846.1 hypothetical protein [Peptoniphilus lacydonensis]
MKKFIRVFIFLQICLAIYLFNISFLDMYDKNNILPNDYNKYEIADNSVENRKILFNTIRSSNYNLITLKSNYEYDNKSRYKIFSLKEINYKKKPLSQSVVYSYGVLNYNRWQDSTNTFYSNSSINELNSILKGKGIEIKEVDKDLIDYRIVIKYFAFNIILLLVNVQLVYLIYFSNTLKRNGLKMMMGFSKGKIIKEFWEEVIKIFIVNIFLIFFVYGMYLTINSKFSFKYFAFLSTYLLILILINSILIYNSTFIIKFIDIENMIKNKLYTRKYSIFLKFLKVLVMSLVLIFTNNLKNSISEIKESNKDLLRNQELGDYYTSYGLDIEADDYRLGNIEIYDGYDKNIKRLLKNNKNYLIDTSNYENYLESKDNRFSFLVCNYDYFKKFVKLDREIDYDKKTLENKILIPQSNNYENKEQVISNLIDSIETNKNYKALDLKLKNEYKKIGNIETLEIPNGNIKLFLNSSGIKNASLPIIYIDDGKLSGSYYINLFSRRGIYFEENNLEDFIQMLSKYKLENLLVAQNALNLFRDDIDNLQLIVKSEILFIVIFNISLIFIIIVSNYVDNEVNKIKYAIMYTLGFSHIKILRKEIFLMLISFIILITLYFVLQISLPIIVAYLLIDLLTYISFYKKVVFKNIVDVIKGV